MIKAYKYRLYLTKKQVQRFDWTLNKCHILYNSCLADRKNRYEQTGKGLTRIDQQKTLTSDKKNIEFLNDIHSQVLQNVLFRVERAFKAFFRRVKAGEKPGYPRFRNFDRYDSFTFPQSGFSLVNDRLKLSKIGSIKIRKHRNIEGTIKTLTIRRTATGKWYAAFSCEITPNPLPKINTVVGIDVGLSSFTTLSTGEKIKNPRFFKTEEKILAKAQRKLSKQGKRTLKRKKVKKVVTHIHEHIANKRNDFAHKLSRKIVTENQVIVFEKLNIKNMMSNHTKVFGYKLNKSIGDVAWNQFMQFTIYKAAEAGRTVIFVNPRNTSKMCSQCGQLVEKTLADRVHHCSCGLVLDRDENAAINILALGTQSLGFALEAPSNL